MSSPTNKIIYLTNGSNKALGPRLRKLGFIVDAVNSKRSAMAAAQKIVPACCIVDLQLPSLPLGYMAVEGMVKFFEKAVPILAVHPTPTPQMVEESIKVGAMTCISALIELTDLAKIIQKFANNSEIQKLLGGDAKPEGEPSPAQAKSMKLDQSFAGIPEYETYEIPKDAQGVLNLYFDEFVPALGCLHACLIEAEDSESRVHFYSQFLKPYEPQFVTFISRLTRSSEKQDVLTGVRVLGIDQTRNLCLTLRLSEYFTPGRFKWDPVTGKPSVMASDVIKYALRTEEKLGEGSRFAAAGFVAGLLYDVLFLSAKKFPENKLRLERLIEAFYVDAMASLEMSKRVAKNEVSVSLTQHLVTTAFMRHVGKVILAMYRPEYIPTADMFHRMAIPGSFQDVWERKNQPVTAQFLGGITCLLTPGLSRIYPAILYGNSTNFLQEHYADLFHLARTSQKAFQELQAQRQLSL